MVIMMLIWFDGKQGPEDNISLFYTIDMLFYIVSIYSIHVWSCAKSIVCPTSSDSSRWLLALYMNGNGHL